MQRIIIITGANRGIGYETARALAKNENHLIIMACRNLEKSIPAGEAIKQESQNPHLEVMALNLSSLASIREFAAKVREKYGRVNILINNAGMTSRTDGKTKDGFEQIVGTNYFGTYYLTRLLLPLFPAGEDNRIINLSSVIYKYGFFHLNKLNSYRWVKAYAVSKYLILLFSLELAQRLKDNGIAVNAAHPGTVSTGIMYTNRWYDIIIDLLCKPFFVNEAEGAKTSIYLAASDEVKGKTGGYFSKGKKKRIPKIYQKPELRKKLWEETGRILGLENVKRG